MRRQRRLSSTRGFSGLDWPFSLSETSRHRSGEDASRSTGVMSRGSLLGVGTTALVKEAHVQIFRDARVETPPDNLFDSLHALGLKSGAATMAVETCLRNTGVREFILYVACEFVIR